MKKTPLVSIIIPVYNVEKYIKQCVLSIVNQTYKNIEIICINDCSTDKSVDIIKTITDKRIKIISNVKNLGVDNSRFRGIDNAIGDYIFFIDSDDWIQKETIYKLVEKALSTNADITYVNARRVFGKYTFISKPYSFNKNIPDTISKPILFDEYYISYFGINLLPVSMWGKLYKTELIKKSEVKPSSFKMGEDLCFNLHLHPFVEKISFINENLYNYRFGGMTVKSNPTFLADVKQQFLLKQNYIRKYNYNRANNPIKYEFINCFYSHFNNLLLFNEVNIHTLGEILKKELEDPFYQKSLYENIVMSEKSTALENKNIDAILAILTRSLTKRKVTRKIMLIASSLLS